MNKKEKFLRKIQRNFRINPSEKLQAFWEAVENNNLHDDFIHFRYYKLKLLTIEQVAEFDYKDIRFWFKHKGERFLVKYYIPIARNFEFSHAVTIAAYDSEKRFLGIFLSNQSVDPIFLTKDLSDLLTNTAPLLSKEDFLKKEVTKVLMLEFDFDYPMEDEDGEYIDYTEEEKAVIFNQKLTDLLAFLQPVYNVTYPNNKFNYKSLKKSFKIFFKLDEHLKDGEAVQSEIIIPKYYEYQDSLDIVISILNKVNFQWWSEDNDNQKKYGFYRVENGIAMLHIEQLCEFVRLGIVPHFSNVQFPSIIYSTHSSGYIDASEYEIFHFETQEEYDKFYDEYMDKEDPLTVRLLEDKDIPKIVNYFLEAREKQLLTDGFDLMKIPFEEQLIEELQTSIITPDDQKNQFIVIESEGEKHYGHCTIERINKNGEAYFYFYDWKGMLNRQPVIDGLLNLAIQLMIETYSLKTIFAEITPDDNYRTEALTRAGFELVKEHELLRDPWSSEQIYQLWKLDCDTFLKANKNGS